MARKRFDLGLIASIVALSMVAGAAKAWADSLAVPGAGHPTGIERAEIIAHAAAKESQ